MAWEGEIHTSKIESQWRFNPKEIDNRVTSQRLDGAFFQGNESGHHV
jgi:hypothetical protein